MSEDINHPVRRGSKAADVQAPTRSPRTPRLAPIQRQITRPVRTEINLGGRLKAERKRRGLSIAQVALAAGVTKSFLSKLENDQGTASVATLLRICDAMGVRPGSLFDPPATKLVRKDEALPINLGGEGMVEYLISGDSNEHLMALRSVIQPGGGSGKEPYSLASQADLIHLQSGTLDVEIDGELFHMQAGDTLTFPPSKPHAWRNPSGSKPAVAIWVIVPPP